MLRMNLHRCAGASTVAALLSHRDSRWHRHDGQWPAPRGPLQCNMPKQQTVLSQSAFGVQRSELVSTSRKQRVDEVYEISGKLGEGAFGHVHVGKCRQTGVKRAVKVIPKTKTTPTQFENEVEALKELDHPHIINIVEYFQDSRNYYIVEELVEGESLYDVIMDPFRDQLPEKRVSCMLRQGIKAVLACHMHGFIHRDIKSDNFMVADDNVKLIDFGLSSRSGTKGTVKGTVGTCLYMAPEILFAGVKEYGSSVDVWSLGVVLFEMLCQEDLLDYNEHDFIIGCIYDMEVSTGRTKEVKVLARNPDDTFECELNDVNGKKFHNVDKKKLRHDSLREVRRLLADPDFVKKRLTCEVLQSREPSEEVMDMLEKMLCQNPDKRITLPEALQHPFIRMHLSRNRSAAPGMEYQYQYFDRQLAMKMRGFVALPRLHQIALLALAHLAADNEFGCTQFRYMFRRMDTNGDGGISLEELRQFFIDNGLEVPNDLEELFSYFQAPKLGTIGYTEFVAMGLSSKAIDEKHCTDAFMLLDRTNSGTLNDRDLAILFHKSVPGHGTDGDGLFRDILLEAEMELRAKEQCKGELSFVDFHTIVRGFEAVRQDPPRMPGWGSTRI